MRLIAARTALTSKGSTPDGASSSSLGLEFRLAPGWNTYWRSPGDAGLPPEVDWSGSENLASAAIEWPIPERETLLGFETLVYRDRVVLPIEARAADPAKPVHLRADVRYLVCETLCVPAEAHLALDLDAAPGAPTVNAPAIAAFAAKVPPRASTELAVEHVFLTETRGKMSLDVSVRSTAPLIAPDLLVEGPRPMRFGRPRLDLNPDRRSGVMTVPVTVAGNGAALGRAMPFTLTLVDRGRNPPAAVESAVTVTGISASSLGGSLATILLLALAGGVILNLMPCVLPVLSMKFMAAVAHADKPLRGVRAGFLATAAGIVASMLALAGIAIAARAAGHAVGWGMQFQSPVFLAAMMLLLVLFGLSVFGVLPIALPVPVAALAGKGPREGLEGSFLAGAFATLLATPCTAPLLGTAVGFALARGPTEILAVFGVLGIGLALPYLVVAAFPKLARLFPRPGPWMKWVRIVLGLALFGTAFWLLSALAVQAGAVAAGASAVAAVIAGVILALGGRRRATTGLAVAVGLAAIVAPLAFGGSPGRYVQSQGPWRPWDRVEVLNDVAAGKAVLVHVTAEWCLNCKVNKILVLDRGTVARRLNSPGTVAMIADWTRSDPRVGRLLADFGRYGIPFDVVYGPKAPAGIALPEILSQEAVLNALDAAGAASPSKVHGLAGNFSDDGKSP